MVNLGELAAVRKYTSEWEVISALFDVPANTTVEVAYNPPKNRYFVYQYSAQGPMKTDPNYDVCIKWDGTISATWYIQGALTDKVYGAGEAPLKVAKNELTIVVTNNSSETKTMDAILIGFNIPENMYQEFLDDLSGVTDRKIALEQVQLLKDIKTSLINMKSK